MAARAGSVYTPSPAIPAVAAVIEPRRADPSVLATATATARAASVSAYVLHHAPRTRGKWTDCIHPDFAAAEAMEGSSSEAPAPAAEWSRTYFAAAAAAVVCGATVTAGVEVGDIHIGTTPVPPPALDSAVEAEPGTAARTNPVVSVVVGH
jgi:hypothetical protein